MNEDTASLLSLSEKSAVIQFLSTEASKILSVSVQFRNFFSSFTNGIKAGLKNLSYF